MIDDKNRLRRIALWSNIPDHLKKNAKWAMATLDPIGDGTLVDKAPRSPITGAKLRPDSDDGWVSFDEVVAYSPPAIGFRINTTDGIVCIDADERRISERKAKSDDPLSIDRSWYNLVEVAFTKNKGHEGTYVERSLSGKGYHVILFAKNEVSMKVGPFDILRQNRFIITTGDSFITPPEPIREGGVIYDKIISKLSELRSPNAVNHDGTRVLPKEEALYRDEEILKKLFSEGGYHEASGLPRGEYMRRLYLEGPLKGEDHSSLDMTLTRAIVKHTRNFPQFFRIFESSALYRGHTGGKVGYENKEVYDTAYLHRLTFTNAVFAWEDVQTKNMDLVKSIDAALKKNSESYFDNVRKTIGIKGGMDHLMPLPDIENPLGLVGDIAEYIYSTAPFPLREGAIAGALGTLAAYVGRHYNLHQTGLALYILLAAKSGRGKEYATRIAQSLINSVSATIPAAEIFMGGSNVLSGAGGLQLLSAVPEEGQTPLPSKLLFANEAGKLFSNLLDDRPSENLVTLQKFLLDVFSKNNWSSVIAKTVYSKKENNINAIKAPSLTILGDMTPEDLPTLITKRSLSSGFVPRWLCIEYRGPRQIVTKQSIRRTVPEPTEIIARLSTIAQSVLRANEENRCVEIQFSEEAEKIYYEYEASLTDKIHEIESTTQSYLGHIYNRSGLMVLKVAGIVAVGCNHIQPIVTVEHIKWAIALVERSALSMTQYSKAIAPRRDEIRADILFQFLTKWFTLSDEERLAYGALPIHNQNKVLPRGVFFENTAYTEEFNVRELYETSRAVDELFDKAVFALVKRGHAIMVSFERTKEETFTLNERGTRNNVDNDLDLE